MSVALVLGLAAGWIAAVSMGVRWFLRREEAWYDGLAEQTPETDALVAADDWKWEDEPPAQYVRLAALCRQMERDRNADKRMRRKGGRP